MSDISILGGALGLGANPSYDPSEAKGYLTTLNREQTRTEGEYKDAVAQRRARVAQMQSVVDDATKALIEARVGRTNLPLMAAGAAMMAPTSTGGLGASLSNAGAAAVPAIERQRAGNDAHIKQLADLKSVPLTMGDGVDKDVAAQLATRANTLQQQSSAVQRGVLTAQTAGMKAVQKEANELRKQAAQEAKNQIAASLRSGATYEGDDGAVERQLTESIYAQLFHQRHGVWPGQAGLGRDASPEEVEKMVPKLPRLIPKETDKEREYYTGLSSAGSTAESTLSALEFAEPTGNQVPGMLAGPALWASRVAEVFGVGGDWGKQLAEAGNEVGKQKAILQNFVLDMQKQQKGVQTEGDAIRMAQTIANVGNTGELNKLMYNWMKSQAIAAKWQADQVDKFVTSNKGRASGINDFANKQRLDLVRPGPNNAKVTLWDFVEGYRKQNPDMPRDAATNKAVEMWKSLQ